MSIKESIGWCDLTLNPVKGKCPVACPYCYARKIYDRFGWNPEIRFVPSVFNDLPRKPSRVFVGSTMELFLFDDWMEFILNRCQDFPQHTFLLLTKKPEKLPQWSPFPPNCEVGVTATNDAMVYKALAALRKIEAKIKYLSLEPLLEWDSHGLYAFSTNEWRHWLDWLILGRLTGYGHKYDPKIEWVEEIVRAADQAGVKVFLKDNLKGITMSAHEVSKHHNLAYTTVCVDQDKNLWRLNDLRQEMPG